jgi:hypothetical protein
MRASSCSMMAASVSEAVVAVRFCKKLAGKQKAQEYRVTQYVRCLFIAFPYILDWTQCIISLAHA